jgi:hypothetical protein
MHTLAHSLDSSGWRPLPGMVGQAVPPAIDWTLRAQRLSVKNLL